MTDTARRSPPRRLQPDWIARTSWLPAFLARPLFGQPLAPTAEEWRAVQEALQHGDEPMDRVVDWMFAAGPRIAKTLFEQALTEGIDSVSNAPAPLREFFAHIDTPPAWLDRTLLEEGARISQLGGNVSFYVLRDMALMGGYVYFNSFNQVLAATGALHKDVGLRLGETGKWLFDVTESGGLDRFGAGFITTIRVRMVHALVRRHLRTGKGWDASTWGLPINQMDMLATYLAFGPVTLLGARLFGVPLGPRDSKAAMHMWRYIGWLSGLEDRWLAVTERDGMRKLFHTFLTHRLPDEKIRLMGCALRDQPLSQNLPALAGKPWRLRLMRRWLYQKHISNSALILGPVQRWRLGIPWYALPWYPLLSAPPRFLYLLWYRLRGDAALTRYLAKSRAEQRHLLESYFAGREVDIIRPQAGHPAHVE